MSTEHRESDLIRSWLDESYEAERDPHDYLDHLLDEVPETPQQRRRWWQFPRFRREAQGHTPTATATHEYQPNPFPAKNGHTPTVIGRTQSMLSPAKAITAGTLVFALGGVMLIAQPLQQQGSGVPGAATDAQVVPATWVTGDIVLAASCSGPTREDDAGVRRERDYLCEPQRWTSSDPRLTGEAASHWNADVYEPDGDAPGPSITVATIAYRLRNEAGGWACRSNFLSHVSGVYAQHQAPETLVCVGDSANDGLSAILVVDWFASPTTFVGLIFPGEAPPFPEMPAPTE